MGYRIGRIIKASRVLKGLKQRDVARIVGVSVGQISHIESDRRKPGRALAKRLYEILCVESNPPQHEETDDRGNA